MIRRVFWIDLQESLQVLVPRNMLREVILANAKKILRFCKQSLISDDIFWYLPNDVKTNIFDDLLSESTNTGHNCVFSFCAMESGSPT